MRAVIRTVIAQRLNFDVPFSLIQYADGSYSTANTCDETDRSMLCERSCLDMCNMYSTFNVTCE